MFGTKTKLTTHLGGEYLKRLNWNAFQEVPEGSEKEGFVVTGWMGQGVVIDPMVERNLVAFRALRVALAPPDETPADRLNNLLLALSELNHDRLLGALCFDHEDGAVDLKVCVPIDDGLSFEAFEHCLKKVLVPEVTVYGPRLKALIAREMTVEDVLR